MQKGRQEVKHTGGNWFIDKNHSGKIMGVASTTRRHDLEFVCLVENEPDARLIAAAPEMYYIISGILAVIDENSHWGKLISKTIKDIEGES